MHDGLAGVCARMRAHDALAHAPTDWWARGMYAELPCSLRVKGVRSAWPAPSDTHRPFMHSVVKDTRTATNKTLVAPDFNGDYARVGNDARHVMVRQGWATTASMSVLAPVLNLSCFSLQCMRSCFIAIQLSLASVPLQPDGSKA
jgi:hypothetical protein